jgi:hypothetical protein
VRVLTREGARLTVLDARPPASPHRDKGEFVDNQLLRRRAARWASLALVSALLSVVTVSTASAATPSGIQGSGHAATPSGIQGSG